MDALSCWHLFSLCHRRREEGEKKRRSQEDKREKKKARRVKLLTGCYCPWRVFKAGEGSLEKENGTLHANCDFAFIVTKTQASQCIGWLMQPFHLQYAPLSSSIQKALKWFQTVIWLNFISERQDISRWVKKKYLRCITEIVNSCFLPDVDFSNQTIWFPLNLKQKEKPCHFICE